MMKKISYLLVTLVCVGFLVGCEKGPQHPLPANSSQYRQGELPQTSDAPDNTRIAHQQLSQNSPIEIQESLWEFMHTLPGVVAGPSKISVSGARALFVPGTSGPTLAGDERVHLHPGYDGSLHIALDQETMNTLVERGWGEFHPRNENSIMLYGARDEDELLFLQSVLEEAISLHEEKKAPQPSPELDTAPLPFSVEALGALTFSGHSLSLEAIENTTASYTRYRIFYMSNGYRISGIMNIPKGEGPFPLVILNHGYIDPAVYTVGRGLKREQDYLARKGFAVLHTDYRNHGLSDKDPILDENYLFRNYFYTQDTINAILAVKNTQLTELRSIDTENVGMLGHSMGGGVTMHALLAQPDLVKAAVLYAPVHSTEWYNFNRRRESDLSQAEREKRTQYLGSLDIEGFAPYSATPHLEKITSPIQIYFGTNDMSVPYARGEEIQAVMSQAGVESKLITYEKEKHEFIREWDSFMEGVDTFFDVLRDASEKN